MVAGTQGKIRKDISSGTRIPRTQILDGKLPLVACVSALRKEGCARSGLADNPLRLSRGCPARDVTTPSQFIDIKGVLRDDDLLEMSQRRSLASGAHI